MKGESQGDSVQQASVVRPVSRWRRVGQTLGTPALAVLTALIVSGLFIVLSDEKVYRAFSEGIGSGFVQIGEGLGSAYGALFEGSFGSLRAISESLTTSVPYIYAGLAVARTPVVDGHGDCLFCAGHDFVRYRYGQRGRGRTPGTHDRVENI